MYASIDMSGVVMTKRSCMIRVNRMFDGHVSGSRNRMFACTVGDLTMETRRVATEVAWRLGGGVACDESMPFVPNSLIGAHGTTVVREGGFAHFMGCLSITDFPQDAAPVLLFVGRMDLIGRIGSHQFLGEACDEREHFEGWIAATGRGPLDRHRMRCVVVGHGELPQGLVGNTLVNRLVGTLFLP
jgi:hypothetical protein